VRRKEVERAQTANRKAFDSTEKEKNSWNSTVGIFLKEQRFQERRQPLWDWLAARLKTVF
jgi:hypothetical protein